MVVQLLCGIAIYMFDMSYIYICMSTWLLTTKLYTCIAMHGIIVGELRYKVSFI